MPYSVGQSVKWLFYKDRSDVMPDVREGVITEIRGIRAVIQSGVDFYLVHFSAIVSQPGQRAAGRVVSGLAAGGVGRCFQVVCSGSGCSPALEAVDSCQSNIENFPMIHYNEAMSEKPQFQTRFPEPFLNNIKRWADLCGISPSAFIFQAVLEGSALVLQKFGVRDEQGITQTSDKVTGVT
jgi:hypothetical protein